MSDGQFFEIGPMTEKALRERMRSLGYTFKFTTWTHWDRSNLRDQKALVFVKRSKPRVWCYQYQGSWYFDEEIRDVR